MIGRWVPLESFYEQAAQFGDDEFRDPLHGSFTAGDRLRRLPVGERLLQHFIPADSIGCLCRKLMSRAVSVNVYAVLGRWNVEPLGDFQEKGDPENRNRARCPDCWLLGSRIEREESRRQLLRIRGLEVLYGDPLECEQGASA